MSGEHELRSKGPWCTGESTALFESAVPGGETELSGSCLDVGQ